MDPLVPSNDPLLDAGTAMFACTAVSACLVVPEKGCVSVLLTFGRVSAQTGRNEGEGNILMIGLPVLAGLEREGTAGRLPGARDGGSWWQGPWREARENRVRPIKAPVSSR